MENSLIIDKLTTKILFSELNVGDLFWYHNTFWVKTSYTIVSQNRTGAAKDIVGKLEFCKIDVKWVNKVKIKSMLLF